MSTKNVYILIKFTKLFVNLIFLFEILNIRYEHAMLYMHGHGLDPKPKGKVKCQKHFYFVMLKFLFKLLFLKNVGSLLDAITKHFNSPSLGDAYAWDHSLIMADIQLLHTPTFTSGKYRFRHDTKNNCYMKM